MDDKPQTTLWRVRPYQLAIFDAQSERHIASVVLTENQAAAIGALISSPGDGMGCYDLLGLAYFQLEPCDG